MRWLLIAVGVLVSLCVLVLVIGFALPVDHVARRSVDLRAAPDEVWAAITDVRRFPEWRDDVDSVQLLAPVEGRQAWREEGENGPIAYAATVLEPPARMVTRITSPDLPFGGEWEYEIAPLGTGSRVTITERGEVYNPVFRFVSRFIIGHTATIDGYLRSLGRKFGETAVPMTPAGG